MSDPDSYETKAILLTIGADRPPGGSGCEPGRSREGSRRESDEARALPPVREEAPPGAVLIQEGRPGKKTES